MGLLPVSVQKVPRPQFLKSKFLFHSDRGSRTSRRAPTESQEGRRGNCKPRGIMPEEMPLVSQTECPVVPKTPHSNCRDIWECITWRLRQGPSVSAFLYSGRPCSFLRCIIGDDNVLTSFLLPSPASATAPRHRVTPEVCNRVGPDSWGWPCHHHAS